MYIVEHVKGWTILDFKTGRHRCKSIAFILDKYAANNNNINTSTSSPIIAKQLHVCFRESIGDIFEITVILVSEMATNMADKTIPYLFIYS